MADPTRPYTVSVTIGNADSGLQIKVKNLTSGGSQTATLDDNKRATVDLANFSNGYTAGDAIQVEIHGRETGIVETTVGSTGGGRLLSITSADSSAPAVTL